MRYWDVQFDSYSAPQQCPGEASYSTKKIVVIVGECVHRSRLLNGFSEPYSPLPRLVCFPLAEFSDLALAKSRMLLFNCWPEGPVSR